MTTTADAIFDRARVPCVGVPPVSYRATQCELGALDPAASLRALAGRTLWMLGDSTMRHQHDALECLLGAATDSVRDRDFPDACPNNWTGDAPGCPNHAPADPAVLRRSQIPRPAPGSRACKAQCRIYAVPGAARAAAVLSPGAGYAGANWTAWEGSGAEAWADPAARLALARTCFVAIGQCARSRCSPILNSHTSHTRD